MTAVDSKTMKQAERTYLPAAGRDWALPFYDPMVKLLGGEKTRQALLDQAALRAGHRVLDIGCGTGTMAVRISKLYPGVEVVGLDPDPKALARARRKAQQVAVSIRFDQGFSDKLPYAGTSFDRVLSSFMFHHLPVDQRGETLREAVRVLAPGGSFHLLDFAGAEPDTHGKLTHWLHSSHHLKDNSEDRILTLMRDAGFVSARKVAGGAMFFGLLHIGYYQGSVAA